MSISEEHLEQFRSMSREDQALELARQEVETSLLSLRNSRIGHLTGGNGFVIREVDGGDSSVIRLRTRDGLRIGIEQYNKVMAGDAAFAEAELLRFDALYDEVEAERKKVEQDADNGEHSAMFIVGG